MALEMGMVDWRIEIASSLRSSQRQTLLLSFLEERKIFLL
mgnify:CR=1 FL=1